MASKKVPAKVKETYRETGYQDHEYTVYIVNSQTNADAQYRVTELDGRWDCGCVGFHYKGRCAHVTTAQAYKAEQQARESAELPTAGCPDGWSVAQCSDGRFYPMRFGKFQLDARDYRIGYGERESAVQRCWMLQREYERDTAPLYRDNKSFSIFAAE